MTSLTPDVEEAIAELRAAFPDREVHSEPDGDGGAYVVVRALQLGSQYDPSCSWIGFHITFQYPDADVYPHYTDASLRRKDGSALGEGFGQVSWRNQQVTQISRRSNRWNATHDTATLKLEKVLEWLRSR